eukprot:1264754-Pleurochrysis_carterae.AAC.1
MELAFVACLRLQIRDGQDPGEPAGCTSKVKAGIAYNRVQDRRDFADESRRGVLSEWNMSELHLSGAASSCGVLDGNATTSSRSVSRSILCKR